MAPGLGGMCKAFSCVSFMSHLFSASRDVVAGTISSASHPMLFWQSCHGSHRRFAVASASTPYSRFAFSRSAWHSACCFQPWRTPTVLACSCMIQCASITCEKAVASPCVLLVGEASHHLKPWLLRALFYRYDVPLPAASQRSGLSLEMEQKICSLSYNCNK